MKAVSKLVVMLSLGVLASVAASADTIEQTYLENCRKDPGVPVPVAVVSPNVGPEYGGTQVELEFVVDQKGKPADVSVKSTPDDKLGTAVAYAIKQWKFKPAERDGRPVATRVVLPVKIVNAPDMGDAFAAN